MVWYKFWKKSGPMQALNEKYIWLDKEVYSTRESVAEECESWAESIPGGHNTHYSFGFIKIIKAPPKSVLENMIKHKKEEISSKKKELEFLKQSLEEIS